MAKKKDEPVDEWADEWEDEWEDEWADDGEGEDSEPEPEKDPDPEPEPEPEKGIKLLFLRFGKGSDAILVLRPKHPETGEKQPYKKKVLKKLGMTYDNKLRGYVYPGSSNDGRKLFKALGKHGYECDKVQKKAEEAKPKKARKKKSKKSKSKSKAKKSKSKAKKSKSKSKAKKSKSKAKKSKRPKLTGGRKPYNRLVTALTLAYRGVGVLFSGEDAKNALLYLWYKGPGEIDETLKED